MLECQADRDYEIRTAIMSGVRALDLYVAISSKAAGKKALFYIKSMVINNTEEDMDFYYESPSEKQIKSGISYKEGVIGSNSKFHMLSDVSFEESDHVIEIRNLCNFGRFHQGVKSYQHF